MIHVLDSLLCGTTFLLAFTIRINNNKVNTKANHWFSAFVFCIFLLVLSNILSYTQLIRENTLVFDVISISSFVITPVYYLSISFYVDPVKKMKLTDYLHFVFPLLMLILVLLAYTITVPEKPENVPAHTIKTVTWVFNVIFSLQVISYCILAYLKIARHQKNIQLFNSTVESINLKWVQHITICILVIALFWVSDIVFSLSESNPLFDIGSSLVYLLGLLYTSYYWHKQREIFPFDKKGKEEIKAIIRETAIPDNNRKKLLSDERLEQLKQALLEQMDSEKPYLDADLSLVKLAASLNTTPHILSYVINKGFGENFFQFINRYRIEEAIKRIQNPEMNHLSILGIGYEVGFNSKTAFNTTFKKMTGKSPSEFKNSVK